VPNTDITLSPFLAFVFALVIPGALTILLAALLWTRRTWCRRRPRRSRMSVFFERRRVQAAIPLQPCLPRRAHSPPIGDGWSHEIKHDGFRILARHEGNGVRLFTCNGYDFTTRFPKIAAAAARLSLPPDSFLLLAMWFVAYITFYSIGAVDAGTFVEPAGGRFDRGGRDIRLRPLRCGRVRLRRTHGAAIYFGARLERIRCKVRRCILRRRAVSETLRPHNS